MPEGMNTGRTTPGLVDAGNTVVNRYLDEVYDRVFLQPGAGVPTGTAADSTVGPAGNIVASVLLPDAVTAVYRWNIRVRDNWRNHYCRVTFWYTSSTGGTANFSLQWNIRTMVIGGNLSSSVIVGDVTANYPGPANANDVVSASLNLTTNVLSKQSSDVLKVQHSRDGVADANNNPYHLLLAELKFYKA